MSLRNKRTSKFLTESGYAVIPHDQITGDTRVFFMKVPTGRRIKIDKVDYFNETGLVADATNVIAISLLNKTQADAVMAGPRLTDSDIGGTSIAAATPTDVTVVTAANANVGNAADVLEFLFDEGGAVTLPPGYIGVHYTWLH